MRRFGGGWAIVVPTKIAAAMQMRTYAALAMRRPLFGGGSARYQLEKVAADKEFYTGKQWR